MNFKMSIKQRLQQLQSTLPKHVTLVAVSKTKPVNDLMEAYNAGQRVFGENKIQEMVEKYHQMPKEIQWHMIGHVQTNKVKYMAPFVDLIHGVDRLKLLKEINNQALKCNRIIQCLLQIKIAQEDSKFGMTADDAEDLLLSSTFNDLKNIKIVGVMGMASFTNNKEQIRAEFETLTSTFERLKQRQSQIEIISMGMSGDFSLAIECGSTMVRVGSHIFGARNYS